MKIVDYISSAQTNLLRTKVRTFLTILAFVIGTFTLAMVTAFSQGLRSYINTQLHAFGQVNIINVSQGSTKNNFTSNGVGIYQPNRQASVSIGGRGKTKIQYTLNQSDLNVVKSAPYIQGAYADYGQVNINYIQVGNSQKLIIPVQTAVPGESVDLSAGQFPSINNTGIVLPYAYVQALGANSPGSLVGQTALINVPDSTDQNSQTYQVKITGILADTAHQPAAYLWYQTVDQIENYQVGPNAPFGNIIAVTSPTITTSQTNQIQSYLEAKGYNVQTYNDILQNFSKPLSVVTYGLSGFAAISLLAATIGIVNTLLMAVLERTQEIGLLKALGMRRRGITLIYLFEAASIGFWGGIIGVVLAWLVGLVANPILNRTIFTGIGNAHLLTYPLTYMGGIIVGAMIIGLLAGTLPAIRAGKLDPIDALRRE